MTQQERWDQLHSGHAPQNPCDDAWLDRYMPFLRDKKAGKVLDLGCGAGDNASRLCKDGFQVIACDFSRAALRRLVERCRQAAFFCFDMSGEWPVEIKDMDAIIASLSTHYFSWADTCALYTRIFDALSEGGYFIFRVNSKEEYRRKDRPYVTRALEADYYALSDGSVKRYFDIATMARLLRPFQIIECRETVSAYHGLQKHCIEGIATKARSLP